MEEMKMIEQIKKKCLNLCKTKKIDLNKLKDIR